MLRARYERQAAGASPDGTEVWANWIVRRREDGTAVGYVQASIGAGGADLAWVIGTLFQRRGYAAEAALAVARFLREAGTAPLTAHIHPEQEERFNRRLLNACVRAYAQQGPVRPGQLHVATATRLALSEKMESPTHAIGR